ncbi:MAG TPA: type II secretion system F family protein [Verrucomicrobiota bacterium]|nr:type II secretion system F family protein [Verrucomicrobiota bacterium]HNU50542.1 type II secretion system F family protein [Verrucomicrobiota bacterium]
MPLFDYRALQPDGTVADGQIEAPGRAEAFQQMESRQLRPIRLVERGSNGSGGSGGAAGKSSGRNGNGASAAPGEPAPGWSLGGGQRVSARMLENFTRLLSSLLAAGVPLSRALVILHREANAPVARARWKEVHDRVVDGMSLANAMAQSPETFPRVYVAMVEAGETGGFLDVVLAQIAEFQARDKEIRGKVMTALLYPTILLVLALGVLTFLLVFFIPRFQAIFSDFGAALPLLTRIIVGASDAVRSYGLFLAAGVVVGVFLLRHWLVSPAGRRTWEGWILRVPAVGGLVARFALARFCRMLGTLLGAGVPLINALNVARRSIGNQILVDAVSTSIDRVKEGQALGPSLSECRTLFSGSVLEMISVAEESGRLDQELVRVAAVTEGDLDRQLRTAVALAEPLMLFAIAVFIGTIFIGMVIPIFSLQDYIK